HPLLRNAARHAGAGLLLYYRKKSGLQRAPPIETPANEKAASGLYNGGRLFFPSHPSTQVDPGRMAFGQERLAVTPLQMAMVAATVANRGVEMEPHVLNRVVDSHGHTILRLAPTNLARPLLPPTTPD